MREAIRSRHTYHLTAASGDPRAVKRKKQLAKPWSTHLLIHTNKLVVIKGCLALELYVPQQ